MKKILKKGRSKLIIEINNLTLKKNYSVKIYEFLYKLKYDIYFNYNLKKKITINDFKKITKNEIVDIFCEKKTTPLEKKVSYYKHNKININ